MHESAVIFENDSLLFIFILLPGLLFFQAEFIFADKRTKLRIIVFFTVGGVVKRTFRMFVGHKFIFLTKSECFFNIKCLLLQHIVSNSTKSAYAL